MGQQGIISRRATLAACLLYSALHLIVCMCVYVRARACTVIIKMHPYCSLISAQCVGGTRVSPVAHFPTDKCRSSGES